MTSDGRRAGLGVALAVAGLYGYFLLFAQFAFLGLLARMFPAEGDRETRIILALMMAGGIAGSFLAPVLCRRMTVRGLLGWALGMQAGLSVLAPYANRFWMMCVISAMTGLSVGIATVALAGNLGRWQDPAGGCVRVGVGTGLAYGLCNLPWVFAAPVGMQCLIAAGMAAVGALGVSMLPSRECVIPVGRVAVPWRWMLIFCALVWLDSAAFTIIQHAPDIREGTWGVGKLWRNAGLHFVAGCLAGWWLSRGRLENLVVTALAVIGVAGIFANGPVTRVSAGWMYPVAVSLYSTALVCWPGLLTGGDGSMKRAAWVFSVAGWVGSANGIAMAENLLRVPWWFVCMAAVVVVAALAWRRGSGGPLFPLIAVLAVGAGMLSGNGGAPRAGDAVARGRSVYISEGCIHCHSRYVRPDGPDGKIWGPVSDPPPVLAEQPVMIGNRRQGPDLSRVGVRRSEAWIREHFLSPRTLEPDSTMPGYAYLFRDGRGDDLIAYLRSGAEGATAQLWVRALQWKPEEGVADPERGRLLFARHCVACHGNDGRGDGGLSGHLAKHPANLSAGPFVWTGATDDCPVSLRVARVIKFGVPGTDMPGHETWDDGMVRDLAAWVAGLRATH